MKAMQHFFEMLKAAGEQWWQDKSPRLGAALAFYSILSIGPLLLIAIAIAGSVFGQDAARGEITSQIRGLVGKDGAETIQQIIANSRQTQNNIWATIVGMVTLLISASGVFGELQDALNTIWRVKAVEGKSVWNFFKGRFLSFSMVLGIGFLLLVSLVITAVLSGISTYVTGALPTLAPFLLVIDFVVTLTIISSLFAMIFKILPDVGLTWRDIGLASLLTGVLFTIGKFFIGLYLGHSAIASTYGAAGSLVILLIWIYYSSQILYFGAEFSKVYAYRFGSKSGLKEPKN